MKVLNAVSTALIVLIHLPMEASAQARKGALELNPVEALYGALVTGVVALQVRRGPPPVRPKLILQGDEIDPAGLRLGMRVKVSHTYGRGLVNKVTGSVIGVEDDALVILHHETTRIPYDSILTLKVRNKRDALRLNPRSAFATGARVRISAPGNAEGRITGTVVSAGADTLVIRPDAGGSLAVPLSSSLRIEASLGRRTKASKGAAYGFLLGTLAMGIPFAAADPFVGEGVGMGEYIGLGAVYAGVPCALIGALIGRSISSEQWHSVPVDRIRLGIAPQRQGSPLLCASFRF